MQSATHTLYLKTATRSRHELLLCCMLEIQQSDLHRIITEKDGEIARLRGRIEALIRERLEPPR